MATSEATFCARIGPPPTEPALSWCLQRAGGALSRGSLPLAATTLHGRRPAWRGRKAEQLSTTVVTFRLGLECGHRKSVRRLLDQAAPAEGALVNCHGCSEAGHHDRVVMGTVAGVELESAGLL